MTLQGDDMVSGKTVLITGGSRGVGRAIALKMAEQGADVMLTYLRKRTAAQEVVSAIEGMGRRAMAVKTNVGDENDLDNVVAQLREFGGPDIFVSNAATGVMAPLSDATKKHWDWTLDANAWGFLALVQKLIPLFDERGGGRVIAISSPGSTNVLGSYGLVGTSKAALESLVRYLAVELAPKGIMVNGVSPGLLDTDATKFLPRSDELLELCRQQTPAGRLVTTEDVADVVLLVSSELYRMVVGQILVVDGGFSLQRLTLT